MSYIKSVVLCAASLALLSLEAAAERFALDGDRDTVVGELRYTQARPDDTLIDVAREFDLGYDQIVSANPGINRWIPGSGTRVTLPHLYVLPGATRRGLVLNIADLRLYFYPSTRSGSAQEVYTYPVSIGRMDWRTPLGLTRVVKKERDPAWRPPPSIRREHALDGDPLPEVIAGGSPDNPLGRFALRLGIPTYLIHGVDERKAFGIGMRVTHGCIRMYPEDIEHLFQLVAVNTPVMLVDEPIKIGQRAGTIYLSVHQPLDEGEDESAPPLPRVSLDSVMRHLRSTLGPELQVNPDEIAKITEEGSGIPYAIAYGNLPSVGKRPETAQQVARPSAPQRTQRPLDREYEEALAKYLTTEEDGEPARGERQRSNNRATDESSAALTAQATPVVREVPRRTPRAVTDSVEDDRVRRYLEDRY